MEFVFTLLLAFIRPPILSELPSQAVLVDPGSFTALSTGFRNSTTFFNPTSSTPPFFQVFDESFLDILGPNAAIYQVSSNNSFPYAHEAPLYYSQTDEVFFASNAGRGSDIDLNNQVAKISMEEVEAKVAGLEPGTAVNVTVTKLNLPYSVQMTNGGTGPYNSNLLFVNSGRGMLPPTVTLVNPLPPYNATVILDNFFGRQYNSINDVKIHRKSGNIFFTDPDYGYLQDFRPAPILPNQVYRFNPSTGGVRVVATGFQKPNGIAFSPAGTTAYVTDTGASSVNPAVTETAPATIFAFDVDPDTEEFKNRRVFAYADTGAPDGIQLDSEGNVYSGCGDGVQVWNKSGTLLGKFFIGSLTPEVAFAGDGRLVILSEFRIFVAHIAAKSVPLTYP
jgi:gluconolactonase